MTAKRTLSLLFAALVAMLSITSCQEPTPTPEPTPDEGLAVNSYAIDGVEYQFGSTAVMMVGENPLIIATPEEGVESAERMFECEEFFSGAVTPLLLGEEFDLKPERRLYTFVSTLSGATIDTIAPDYLEELESGKCIVTKSNNLFTLKAQITLYGGTRIEVHIQAEENFVINENKISRGEEEKPLRAAFHKTADGFTQLYFTPAGLDYFEELDIASWYLYVGVEDRFIDGDVHNLENLATGKFLFGVVDNVKSESQLITHEDMQGATGTVRISREGNKYTAELNIELGEVDYHVAYNGECTSWELAPEVKTNYLTYDKKEIDLKSATIDTSSEVWVVELTAANATKVKTTAPANFFTGVAKGFSQSPDLTVTYLKRTYSKANGDSGTFIGSYDEATGHLELEFIGYDNLSFVYSGACTSISK